MKGIILKHCIFFLLLTLVYSGCASSDRNTDLPNNFRQPTEEEHSRAVDVAFAFAEKDLGLFPEHLVKLSPDIGSVWIKENVIFLQIFNPERFPSVSKSDHVGAMLGGFPDYFTVTIDLDNWEVVDHYASTR